MHQNENECRVVKMFDSPPSHGPNLPAWQFLVPGADIIHLVNYFIHPHKNCNIKCDRTIMQNWGGGVITHMREDHAKILMASGEFDGRYRSQATDIGISEFWTLRTT